MFVMKTTTSKVGFFLLVVLIGLSVSIFAIMRMNPPVLVNGEVGIVGGIQLRFREEMQTDSIDERLVITPGQEYQLKWAGKELTIWPATIWQTDSNITVFLQAGGASTIGRKINRDVTFQVSVREENFLFLTTNSEVTEIWKSAPSGETSGKLVEKSRIVEASGSFDGEWIVYGEENDMGGVDLWIVDREGKQPRLIVECGRSVCSEFSWQPYEHRIAYSLYRNGPQGIPHVWSVDTTTGEKDPFFEDESSIGQFSRFSPDGDHLSLFNPELGGIYFQNLVTGTSGIIQTVIPQQAVWSPDGKGIYFLRSIELEGQPVDKIYKFDLEKEDISLALGFEDDLYSYGKPAWLPDGSMIAVPIRQIDGGLSSQIWLFTAEGVLVRELTSDPVYTHGGLAWSNDGKYLLIQRLAVDSSDRELEILIWDVELEKILMGIQGGYGGVWLP